MGVRIEGLRIFDHQELPNMQSAPSFYLYAGNDSQQSLSSLPGGLRFLGQFDSLAVTDGVGSKFLEAPEIWGVEDLAENSVVIRVVIKVLPGEHWQIARILRAAIKEKFDASNIEIPFPQVKIWQ